MSNTICIGKEYVPFKWTEDGLKLLAFVKGYWIEVKMNGKINKYGDAIFSEVKR